MEENIDKNMNDVYNVVFVDGQTLMGEFKRIISEEHKVNELVLKNIVEIKIRVIGPNQAELVVMSPTYMGESIMIPIGNFVKFYGVVNEKGKEFYKEQTLKLRGEKSNLKIITDPNDIGRLNRLSKGV